MRASGNSDDCFHVKERNALVFIVVDVVPV